MIEYSNYVCATPLDNFVLAKGANGSVIDQSASMLAEIERRCGADVAMLFARPAVKSTAEGSIVTWFAASHGPPRPLADFDEIARRPFAQILRARLARLLPLLVDQEIGPAIGGAFNVRSSRDIYVVGRDPVIVNWGMLPRDVASSDIAREAHFRSILGPFVPSSFPTPPFDLKDAAAFRAAIANYLQGANSRDVVATQPSLELQVPQAARATESKEVTKKHRSWIAPMIACVLATIAILAVTRPGVLLRAPISSEQALVDKQRKILQTLNHSLEQHISELNSKSAELVCRAPPSATNVSFAPLNLLPPPPQRISISTSIPGGPTNAAELAAQAVVLVRSQFDSATVTGNAFFISEQLLITNDRAVSDSGGREATVVTIENETLGKRIPVRVLARTRASDLNGVGLALLEAPAKASRTFLKIAQQPERGAAIRSITFRSLDRKEDIPGSTIIDGIVSDSVGLNGDNIIVHSATAGPGGTGGPLMDLCSRAVGVNFSWPADSKRPSEFFLAQRTELLLEFLKANGKPVSLDTAPCVPTGIAFGKASSTTPSSPALSPAIPSASSTRPPG